MENKREKRAARMAGGNGNGMGGGRGSGVFGSRNQLDEVDAGIAAMRGAGGSGAALLEALESDGTPGGQPATPLAAAAQQQPTMMSKEARALMMAGLGDEGLQLWKVRGPADIVPTVAAEGCRLPRFPASDCRVVPGVLLRSGFGCEAIRRQTCLPVCGSGGGTIGT